MSSSLEPFQTKCFLIISIYTHKNCVESPCDLKLLGRHDHNEAIWLYGFLGIMTASAWLYIIAKKHTGGRCLRS